MAALSHHWEKKYSGGGSCLPSLFAPSIYSYHDCTQYTLLKTSSTVDRKLQKVIHRVANEPAQQSVGYIIYVAC